MKRRIHNNKGRKCRKFQREQNLWQEQKKLQCGPSLCSGCEIAINFIFGGISCFLTLLWKLLLRICLGWWFLDFFANCSPKKRHAKIPKNRGTSQTRTLFFNQRRHENQPLSFTSGGPQTRGTKDTRSWPWQPSKIRKELLISLRLLAGVLLTNG